MKNVLTNPNNSPVFEWPITIKSEDIDELGHVNNVVYLRWVQEVASAHWQSKAMKAITDQHLWVVLRHEIDYLRPALIDDRITGQTWVSSMDGVKSVRHVKFIANGVDVAQATTVWCLLDAATIKPKRIGEDIRAIFM
ncbi:thioesterase [Cytophagales bacterium WSM2-2]|nr:thioesterase [Cytophagales bacterium WSM2-2]